MGHDVVSTWLDEAIPPPGMSKSTFDRKLGLKDLAESASADLVIVDLLEPSTTGGRYVELGLAIGRFQRQSVWLVGPLEGVFHYLADASFATWDECLALLTSSCLTPAEKAQIGAWDAKMSWLESDQGPND